MAGNELPRQDEGIQFSDKFLTMLLFNRGFPAIFFGRGINPHSMYKNKIYCEVKMLLNVSNR